MKFTPFFWYFLYHSTALGPCQERGERICQSTVFSKEEKGQNTGAGMRADNSANVVDVNVLGTVLFFQNPRQIFGILRAVAVGDKHGLVVKTLAQFRNLLSQRVNGCLAATGFRHIDQVAFVIHVQHGLDLQHGANQARAARG